MSRPNAGRRKGRYVVETLSPGLYEWTHESGSRRWTLQLQVSGKRSERTLKVRTRTEAKAEAARIRGQLAAGESLIPPSRVTLREAFALYAEHIEGRIAEGARSRRAWEESLEPKWRLYVEPAVGNVRLSDLGKTHIHRVLQEVKTAGRSSWHERGVLVLLSGFCEFAVAHDLIRTNPVRSLPATFRPTGRDKRETFAPSQDEVERVLKAAPAGWRVYLTTLADTGARANEALGLRWADLDFERNLIRIEAQLDRKGLARVPLKTQQSRREVPMTARLRRALLQHRMASAHKADTHYVFSVAGGGPMTYTNGYRALQRAIKKAKLDTAGKRFGLHSFRHAYATRLILAGLDPQVIARLLGHSSTGLLFARYSHAFETLRGTTELGALVEAALTRASN